jgi:hypothetical protein
MLVAVTPGAPLGSTTPGNAINVRGINTNEMGVSEVHARYYEGSYRKTRYNAAMQAVLATATIAGLSTSITGTSVLYNPPGSTVNLVVEKFGVGFVLAPAAPLVYGLACGFSNTALSGTLTSLSPRSNFIGSASGQGQCAASAAITLPIAPTVTHVLGQLDTGAITTVTGVAGAYDLEGGLILPPGGFAVFWTSAVLAASAHIASWQWEETPV